MGIFGGYKINQAKVSGGGTYIEPGQYVLEIEETKGIEARGKGGCYVVDFIVRESNNEKHPVGSRCNSVTVMNQDWAGPNVKGFLAAAIGLDATSTGDAAAVEAEDFDAILETSVVQPIFKGKLVHCNAVTKNKKTKPGETFTRLFFSPHASVREALHGKASAKKVGK